MRGVSQYCIRENKIAIVISVHMLPTPSVRCQLSDYVFLRRVPRCTIIAKTLNLHQKVEYRQDYKYRKLHADTQKTSTVVLSLVQTKEKINYIGTRYVLSEINTS